MRRIGPNDTIGYGIVGCGVIAPWQAAALVEQVKGVRLLACCGVVRERAEQLAARYSVPGVYTHLEEMLPDPEIDAISIHTPTGEDARPAVGIILAVYQSARPGRPGRLPLQA